MKNCIGSLGEEANKYKCENFVFREQRLTKNIILS